MNSNPLNDAIAVIDGLIKKSKPGTSTPMGSAIVALYTADAEGELRYSNCIGLLQLDMDRSLKTKMLRLYNIQTLSLVFEAELYYGFAKSYKLLSPTFYIFEYPRGIIGLLFKTKDQADLMNAKIQSNAPPMKEYEEIRKARIEEAKQKKKEGSFFNKIKGFFNDDQPKQQEVASVVMEVRKQRSISFDIVTGTFNTEHVPPEWQQLFDTLKLSKEDLKDKEVVNIIVEETIMQQVKNQAEQSMDGDLQRRVKEAEAQNQQYMDDYRKSRVNGLPPPPPPPPLLSPPQAPQGNRASYANKRANLMQEIRNNKVKLNHVVTSEGGINLDLTNMNKEDRLDHAERLRMKLKMRKKALNRRQASDQSQSD